MARLSLPDDQDMTHEQLAVCHEVQEGLRKKIPAPMIAWLRNPELARRGQRLGELLRFETTLRPALTEIAILACARHWDSYYEWVAHRKLALEAGVSKEIISAIANNQEPPFSNLEEKLVYSTVSCLLSSGRLPTSLYNEVVGVIGESALVELVATVGYYCLVSLTLNTFEIGLPDDG